MERNRGLKGPFPCVEEAAGPWPTEGIMKSWPKIISGKMIVYGTGGDRSKDFEKWKELQEK